MKRINPYILATIISCLYLAVTSHAAQSTESDARVISITNAVETALQNNLNLKLKQQEVELAQGSTKEAESIFDPLLSADIETAEQTSTPITVSQVETEQTTAWNASVRKRFSPGTEVDLSWKNGSLNTDSNLYLFDPIYNTGVTLGVSQPLLRGRGTEVQEADINSARTALEASSFLVSSEASDLAAQVKKAYWELVYSHQNLEVLQLALTLAEKLRDDTSAKIKAGKLANIDIFQPESEVARREEDLISGERAIGVAEDNLKLLMNSQDWLIPLKPSNQPETEAISPNITTVLKNAMVNRPDLQAASLQIKQSGYQLKKAENNTLPKLDLNGAIGFGGKDDSYGSAVDRSFDDSETQWRLGITFSRPFNNSLAEGRLRQAAAKHKKDSTTLELLKQNIRRTVRVTVRDITLALKAIEATGKTAVATQKRLEAEHIKFNAGRSTTLDVLIAQQDYSKALSAQHRSKVVYAQTRAELDRIQGVISIPTP